MNLDFDGSMFKPTPWLKLKRRIDRLLERHTKFIAKVESQKLRSADKAKAEQLNCISNLKNIPARATIKQEYIKCGRSNCSKVKHGPYFYAYWKDDNGELRKKYIGKYLPTLENTNKDKNLDHSRKSNGSGNVT
jgi:hypothetical protein